MAYSGKLPPEIRNEFNQWVDAAAARNERLDDAIMHALQEMDNSARN